MLIARLDMIYLFVRMDDWNQEIIVPNGLKFVLHIVLFPNTNEENYIDLCQRSNEAHCCVANE